MRDLTLHQTRPAIRFEFVISIIACALLLGCAGQKPKSEATYQSSAPKPQTAVPAPEAAKPSKPSQPTTATPGIISNQAWVEKLYQAAAQPSLPFDGAGWEAMFKKNLAGWNETKFAGHGEVQVESGLVVLNMGDPFTGVNYTNAFPKMGYEIALDAMRVMGSDFFCGLTIPVGDSFCSLIVGGWGGSLVGISSLDGMDASENETTKYMNFENGKWYRIRLRVTEGRLEGWIDNEKLINVLTKDRKISLRAGEIDLSTPIGIACWQSTTALREIKYRKVDQPDGPPKKY